jgi:hypothetical protein
MNAVFWGEERGSFTRASPREAQMDANELIRNCNAYPPEELAHYAGQYVAWSMDGKTILAHAAELQDLAQEMTRQGIKDYVSEWIFPADQVFLGSAEL